MRTSSKSRRCATSHRTASRRSLARLLQVMASSGLLYWALDRVLTFADHQHLALGRHDVDLAFRAPPVAVEDP
jgi:hypothetical protein